MIPTEYAFKPALLRFDHDDVDIAHLTTPFAKIVFLRIRQPLKPELKETHLWTTMALWMDPNEPNSALAVSAVETSNPALARRPMPGEDPIILEHLIQELSKVVADIISEKAGLPSRFQYSEPPCRIEDILAQREASTEMPKTS